MGYSTSLYAVDIPALTAAVGSKDAALLDRVRAALAPGDGVRVDPTKGPRVKVGWDGEIEFNGARVAAADLRGRLREPAWAGTWVYVFEDAKPPPGRRREGAFREPGSFAAFLQSLLRYEPDATGVVKKHITGVNACRTAAEFAAAGTPADDLTDEQAVAELVAGVLTRPRNAATYGYALENLCRALGTFLDAVGTDQLKSLQLKTPLSKPRSPVKLPKTTDFPVVSFLDAAEVLAEVGRLRATDLADRSDRENEAERRKFLRCLEQAAAAGRGVVGFYY